MEVFFQNIAVAGIPLLAVVLGVVQWLKMTFKLEGWIVRVVSMGVGVALGFCYQLSLGIPADFAGWFSTVIFGLALGLVASGIYDAAQKS